MMWPVLLVLTLLASVSLSLVRHAGVVPESTYRDLSSAVRARFVAGDLIVATPHYLIGPQAVLGDLPFLAPRQLVSGDLDGHRRVHLVAVGGAGSAGELLERLGVAEARLLIGDVALTTYALRQPTRVVYELGRGLERAKVTARYADATTVVCDRWQRDRYVCPRDPSWSYVGREVVMAGSEARSCVWLHPLGRGEELRVELPQLGPGPGLVVALGYGFTDQAAERARAPVTLRVYAGERSAYEAAAAPPAGWTRARVEVGDQPVALTVETSDNSAAHFCVTLALVEPEA
jgi:hypothetical protein